MQLPTRLVTDMEAQMHEAGTRSLHALVLALDTSTAKIQQMQAARWDLLAALRVKEVSVAGAISSGTILVAKLVRRTQHLLAKPSNIGGGS